MRTVPSTDPDAARLAAAALDAGDLVVLPGDLADLLAADALADDALERLLAASGRGADRPLLVLLGGVEDLHHVAYPEKEIPALAEAHWPGATTIVLRARPWVPEAVTAGGAEVHVSVPANPFTRQLAREFGPLAACRARASAEAALKVDAGALPGGEAKVIRAGGPAQK